MSIRDDFFTAQAKASLWDVAVSIKRGNPLPLDANSVFKALGTVGGADYTGSLLEYATSNPVAYPGQICAVVGETATTIYYLDQNLAIQPVGIIPTGDGKTIEVTEAGAISLLGAAGAANGTLPMIDSETGKLVWKTLEDIGAGDGNDNTTYEFAFANQKITVTPKFNGIAQTAVEIDLSVFVTGDELNEAIKDFATKGYVDGEVDKLEEAISKIDFVDEDELATALAPYAKTADVNAELAKKAAADDLTALTNKVNAFLEGTGATDALDSLQELIEYINTHDDADIAGILEDIQALENKLAGIDTTVVAYVTAAIDALKIGDYAKASDLTALAGRVKALEDVDNFTQAEFATFNEANTTAINAAKQGAIDDAATKYAPKTTVYTKDEIDDLLEGIEGGASESAASVNTKLEAYKKIVNAEVWGDEAGTGDASGNSRIDLLESAVDALEAVGAQANVIEEVKSAADNRLSVTTSGKTVTIDDANLRTDIAAALKAGTDAGAAAGVNASAISGHDTRIGALETAKNGFDTSIKALQDADTIANGKISALETKVNNETSGVAATYAIATQNKSDIATLVATDKTHGEDIAALKETVGGHTTTLQNVNAALENIYRKNEVYTKGEVDSAVNAAVADKITAAALAPYAKTADVEATYATIANLEAEAKTARVAEKANADAIAILVGNVEGDKAKSVRAIAAEEINALIKAADDEGGETIENIANLVDYVEKNAGEIAALVTQANASTAKLADVETTVGALVDEKIAAIKPYELPAATADKLGGIKASESIAVAADGTATVAKVSTDVLVQGTEELILFGGAAK